MTADEDLTEQERCLLAALSAPNPRVNLINQDKKVVRAEVIYEILTGERKPPTGVVKALRLRGARITGELNLEAATLVCPLELVDCHFERALTLQEAQASSIRLVRCLVPGIRADQLRTRGNLELFGLQVRNAQVRLANARIGGSLDLRKTNLVNRNGCVLAAQGLVVDEVMFCGDGFAAEGNLQLTGARLAELDFTGTHLSNAGGVALSADQITVQRGMSCERAVVKGQIRLGGARIGGQLRFTGAEISHSGDYALHADGITVGASLFFDDGFTSTGEVRLTGGHIGDQLSLNGAILTRPRGQALAADLLTVGKDVLLRNGFTCSGTVRLVGSRIQGDLDFDGARLSAPGAVALNGDGLKVEGAMICRDVSAEGEVRLHSAHIHGELNLHDATFVNRRKYALNAPGLTVGKSLYGGKVTARGEVSLDGAQVGGIFTMAGARLFNPGGCALNAQGLAVGRTMFCIDGFAALGRVRLNSAKIGGELDLRGARLAHRGGTALSAYNLTTEQDLRCTKMAVLGKTDLDSAHIGGYVHLDGAKLIHPGGIALDAQRLTVERTVFCNEGFKAQGEVRLVAANITGQLAFDGARLSNADGRAIDLERAKMDSLIVKSGTRFDGVVDLTNTKVGTLDDDRDSWPDRIQLRGFGYDVLDDAVSVRDRLGWLARNQDGYAPGPYDQLSAAYRRAGRVAEARTVAVAKQWRRRRELRLPGKVWNWLLYLTVGYGYRTWQAALWLVTLLAVGTAIFATGYPVHFRPASATVPDFHPVAYAIDVLIPLVDLGQRKTWLARDHTQIWSWAMTGAGWLLTTAVVAGLTNALKRD